MVDELELVLFFASQEEEQEAEEEEVEVEEEERVGRGGGVEITTGSVMVRERLALSNLAVLCSSSTG